MVRSYVYPAIVSYDDDSICVSFVDLDEAYTDGQTESEMLHNAVEVLKLTLRSRIDDKEEIPKQTELKDIKLEKNQKVIYISVELNDKSKYVKKTLTIPESLDFQAKKNNINFSKVLTEALEKELIKYR
jgi:antitoxin HicB